MSELLIKTAISIKGREGGVELHTARRGDMNNATMSVARVLAKHYKNIHNCCFLWILGEFCVFIFDKYWF